MQKNGLYNEYITYTNNESRKKCLRKEIQRKKAHGLKKHLRKNHTEKI